MEVLPKHPDEHVARPLVGGFGGVMTTLTATQVRYVALPVQGPFKNDTYRY